MSTRESVYTDNGYIQTCTNLLLSKLLKKMYIEILLHVFVILEHIIILKISTYARLLCHIRFTIIIRIIYLSNNFFRNQYLHCILLVSFSVLVYVNYFLWTFFHLVYGCFNEYIHIFLLSSLHVVQNVKFFSFPRQLGFLPLTNFP